VGLVVVPQPVDTIVLKKAHNNCQRASPLVAAQQYPTWISGGAA